MKLSEETAQAVVLAKHLYDRHIEAIDQLVRDLTTQIQRDIPEFTVMETLHFVENFQLEEPDEN